MAERYGGKFSPQGATRSAPSGGPAPRGRRRSRRAARVNMLFLVPFLFVLTGFSRDPIGLAASLAGFGLLIAAAYLTREGLTAEAAYAERAIARRPAIPRKLFASVLTGAGLFAAAFQPDGGLSNAIVFAILGTVLHGIAFGADPMRDKTSEGVDTFQADRVARVVDEAESYLAEMRQAIERSGDRALIRRVEAFTATARDMCRTVEEDPRDLTGARKYLGVYLLGARDATRKFAELWARSRDAEARSDYEGLLDDLEKSFAARTAKMLTDDRSDLDIEIEVLRERLAREGIRTD